jgi:hypothetical protein
VGGGRGERVEAAEMDVACCARDLTAEQRETWRLSDQECQPALFFSSTFN